MRSLTIAIVSGMLISTLVMVSLLGSGFLGYSPAMNMLLELTMPSFNIAASLAKLAAINDLDGGAKMIILLLIVAWVQIGLIAAVAAASMRTMASRKSA